MFRAANPKEIRTTDADIVVLKNDKRLNDTGITGTGKLIKKAKQYIDKYTKWTGGNGNSERTMMCSANGISVSILKNRIEINVV